MKDIFRTLRRLHFWIICPIVVVMGVVGWWMATSAIQKDTASRVSKINSQYQTVAGIQQKSPHPNDDVKNGMEALINARRDEVAEAWTEKYEQQVQGDLMTWEFSDWEESNRRRFIRVVKELRPIEKTVKFPTESEPLVHDLRMYYRDYITRELPRLAEIIRARWSPGNNRRGGGPPQMNQFRRPGEEGAPFGDEVTDRQRVQTIVEWDPANQAEIVNTHFSWDRVGGRMMMQEGMAPTAGATAERPTTLDILYAQEDFWVLKAIMKMIDKTNVDPHDPSQPVTTAVNATVKRINYIRIGANAAMPEGRIERLGMETGADGTMLRQGMDMMQGAPPPMMREGDMGMGGGSLDPAEGRYVDKNYQALPAETLRAAIDSEDAVDPESVYLVVAKRMPVRMGLRVDQRGMNRLLQECASGELTIEIRQVRVNQASTGGGGRLPGMMPPGMMQPGERPGRLGRFGRGGATGAEEAFSYDIDVELYGIIYIYNPVDRAVLGYEDAAEEGTTSEENLAAT